MSDSAVNVYVTDNGSYVIPCEIYAKTRWMEVPYEGLADVAITRVPTADSAEFHAWLKSVEE